MTQSASALLAEFERAHHPSSVYHPSRARMRPASQGYGFVQAVRTVT
jgi:hypothetical protein